MNVAYCVICYKIQEFFRKWLIYYIMKMIYIHGDKKVDINKFLNLKEKVNFLDKREVVSWGSFSQIEVMLKLLNATKGKEYDYIVLLSGDCLPLKSSSEIKSFLLENRGSEYIGVIKNINQEKGINQRVKYKYSSKFFKKGEQKNYLEKIITRIQFRWNL